MLEAVRRLVDEVVLPSVERWDRDDELPDEVLEAARRARCAGRAGAGAVRRAGAAGRAPMVDVWRTLAQGWISLTGAVNTTALATELLVRYGTEAQRERWLPGIATGEVLVVVLDHRAGRGQRPEPDRDVGRAGRGRGCWSRARKRWIAGGFSFPLAFMLATVKGQLRPSCILLPVRRARESRRGRSSRSTSSATAAWSRRRGCSTRTTRRAARCSAARPEWGRARGRCWTCSPSAASTSPAAASGSSTGRWSARSTRPPSARSGAGRCSATTATRSCASASSAAASSWSRRPIRAAAEAVDRGDDDAAARATAAKIMASESAVWAVELRLAAGRQPLLHRRHRAGPAAPRRTADPDRRRRERRVADRGRQGRHQGAESEPLSRPAAASARGSGSTDPCGPTYSG